MTRIRRGVCRRCHGLTSPQFVLCYDCRCATDPAFSERQRLKRDNQRLLDMASGATVQVPTTATPKNRIREVPVARRDLPAQSGADANPTYTSRRLPRAIRFDGFGNVILEGEAPPNP